MRAGWKASCPGSSDPGVATKATEATGINSDVTEATGSGISLRGRGGHGVGIEQPLGCCGDDRMRHPPLRGVAIVHAGGGEESLTRVLRLYPFNIARSPNTCASFFALPIVSAAFQLSSYLERLEFLRVREAEQASGRGMRAAAPLGVRVQTRERMSASRSGRSATGSGRCLSFPPVRCHTGAAAASGRGFRARPRSSRRR